MTVLESQINVHDEEFASNAKYMREYVDKVRQIEAKQRETEEKFRARAVEKGKWLPRERLALLLDPGSPFVELYPIAGYGMYDDSDGRYSGGSLITGIGYVSTRRCLIIVWNFAIKGGTINVVNVKKMLAIQRLAFLTRLPVVQLHESGGGNLSGKAVANDPWAPALFTEGGTSYCQQAQLSAAGIPQITVAHGNATAGGAYQVALSDYIVLVKNQTQLFLAGPPLLKAGTGEEADAETLGGAQMHAEISGTGEYLAEDDADGIRIARQIVDHLPLDPIIGTQREVVPPRYDPEELIGIYPENRRKPVRAQEIIARIADNSEFMEFNVERDPGTVCGQAHIDGLRVGIISNNGPITPGGANKVAQFIQLCEQAFTPFVFLQNTTGFLVGTDVEQRGQVKHSAKMIQAVANTRLPKITILVGNSYGAGNYAMASRALKPDFVFSWPSAREALMGGAQAAKVMTIVTEGKWERKGTEVTDEMRSGLQAQTQMIEFGLEMISESIFCSSRLMDDAIIDPRDTRKIIAFCLRTCLEARERKVQGNPYGVPRF